MIIYGGAGVPPNEDRRNDPIMVGSSEETHFVPIDQEIVSNFERLVAYLGLENVDRGLFKEAADNMHVESKVVRDYCRQAVLQKVRVDQANTLALVAKWPRNVDKFARAAKCPGYIKSQYYNLAK